MTPVEAVLALAAVPFVSASGYLLLLSLASARTQQPAPASARFRFVIVVPAHDEAGGVGATVHSLLALDYPRDLVRVLVVADNCTDETAAVARAAGAEILVRDEPARRGKGYALAYAFEHVLAEGVTDAVVVVDADTLVSPNLLSAFAARLESGASVAQADYSVRNPDASWRTRLLAIAFAAFHGVRSLGRERLGLSCGLRGDGMCFTTSLLARAPYDAFSLVEDLEYGVRLGQAGHRVFYVHEAQVYGEMASGEKTSRAQRRRWERGRSSMARRYALPLLARGARRRDPVALDLAIDLLVPPLATLALGLSLGLIACAAVSWRAGHVASVSWPWLAAALALLAHGARAWQLSGTGGRGLLALLFAPAYVLWKVTLPFRHAASPRGEWVRTARKGEAP